MKKLNKKTIAPGRRGFTLIELLVVITIIGSLSTMAVVALGNARAKARDAKRQSDLKIFQTAIELYINDNEAPPDVPPPDLGAWNITLAGLLADYLPGGLPQDPTDRIWCYCKNAMSGAGDQYLIATSLEQPIPDIPGDVDTDEGTMSGIYSIMGHDCICSDDGDPSAIDCRDGTAGSVDDYSSITAFCLGSAN